MSGSSNKVKSSNIERRKDLDCDYLCLKDYEKKKQSFKLFKEDDFPEQLKKYMKINSICEEHDISNC